MEEKASRISEAYLTVFSLYLRNPSLKRGQIGPKALAAALRALVDECDTMTLKTGEEIYQIANDMERLGDEV